MKPRIPNPIKIVLAVIIFIGLLCAVMLPSAKAQSTSGIDAIYQGFENSGLLSASNYSFEPYVTYAPKAPKHIGAGFLAIYNVNNYVGVGIGGDELGRFNMLSANATLQLPIQPLGFVTNFSSGIVTNGLLYTISRVYVTPFQLIGAATPLGGTGTGTTGGIVTEDSGVYIQFGHLWGGQFNVGGANGRWDNAGPYSGPRWHGFLGWSKNFK